MTTNIREFVELDAGLKARERRDKFVKLAEKRTINAIKAIRTIAKLGNKAHYDFDENDVRKIASTLHKELEALKMKMMNRGPKETIEFKL